MPNFCGSETQVSVGQAQHKLKMHEVIRQVGAIKRWQESEVAKTHNDLSFYLISTS